MDVLSIFYIIRYVRVFGKPGSKCFPVVKCPTKISCVQGWDLKDDWIMNVLNSSVD